MLLRTQFSRQRPARHAGHDGPGKIRGRRLKTDSARPRKRVLLVDRHVLMRRAAAGWINHCSDLEVCGMVGIRAQALRAVVRLHPNLVVSEIMRPQDLGFIRELHRRHPRLAILVFSIQDEVVYGARARAAGARAYLTKAAGGTELVRSVRALLRRRGRANDSRLRDRRRAGRLAGPARSSGLAEFIQQKADAGSVVR